MPIWKKNKFSIISCMISTICVAYLFYINHQIAIQYQKSDGKTKALFGMIEYLKFGYKYYLIIPEMIAILLGIKALITKEDKAISYFSIGFGCIAIALVCFSFWKFMV